MEEFRPLQLHTADQVITMAAENGFAMALAPEVFFYKNRSEDLWFDAIFCDKGLQI